MASSSDASFLSRAAQYASWDLNSRTRALHASAPQWPAAELSAAFGGPLEFGTAGLRAAMGPGSARLNDVTICAAAQGLVAALLAGVHDAAARGVVIGWDHRAAASFGLSSRRFALLTAAVALERGVRVFLYGELVATPLVPFAVTRLGAAAGVMVTASHNPKQDNGYKVYWGNGAQIVAPLDRTIAAAIAANEAPWAFDAYARALDGGSGEAVLIARTVDPFAELVPAYVAATRDALWRDEGAAAVVPAPKIVYTAMHGVGARFAAAVFDAFKLPPFTAVASQCTPDPDFPTVAFPNPEEAGALSVACAAADDAGASLVLANDPDADRLAIAEWLPHGADADAWSPRAQGAAGRWRAFSGNEIGALLAGWCLDSFKSRGRQPESGMMSASTVSSTFLSAMAAKENFVYVECLTGFKYMGNAMAAAEERGLAPIFSFEEAIGFCCGSVVRDKDGVSAMAVAAQMARAHARAGRSLSGALTDLYARYGARVHNNGYVVVPAAATQAAIFARLVNDGHYWARVGPFNIVRVRDLRAPGFDSSTADRKPLLPTGSSNMLTFTFSNGVVATLRGSGTEPVSLARTPRAQPRPAAFLLPRFTPPSFSVVCRN
jgi:phosphoglucomutase/phosphopentomutase